uniref:Uncharacterized protein n=1 Tax=Tetraselmis sp. GSL018 TaxID=582737 RepID=A0A061S5Q2_9CHLO
MDYGGYVQRPGAVLGAPARSFGGVAEPSVYHFQQKAALLPDFTQHDRGSYGVQRTEWGDTFETNNAHGHPLGRGPTQALPRTSVSHNVLRPRGGVVKPYQRNRYSGSHEVQTAPPSLRPRALRPDHIHVPHGYPQDTWQEAEYVSPQPFTATPGHQTSTQYGNEYPAREPSEGNRQGHYSREPPLQGHGRRWAWQEGDTSEEENNFSTFLSRFRGSRRPARMEPASSDDASLQVSESAVIDSLDNNNMDSPARFPQQRSRMRQYGGNPLGPPPGHAYHGEASVLSSGPQVARSSQHPAYHRPRRPRPSAELATEAPLEGRARRPSSQGARTRGAPVPRAEGAGDAAKGGAASARRWGSALLGVGTRPQAGGEAAAPAKDGAPLVTPWRVAVRDPRSPPVPPRDGWVRFARDV